ncbi:hypothetical protein AC578_9211 [Pseudocercospora eumusae]|uniref:Uncharacterized protein n=1 Tax=Pseudocercospora eumusae TaxID=321146 RepID=A0A139HVB2_9PEZI|nr:hypothetical protein AC578_9211 [Pseudocercospora eumusae]
MAAVRDGKDDNASSQAPMVGEDFTHVEQRDEAIEFAERKDLKLVKGTKVMPLREVSVLKYILIAERNPEPALPSLVAYRGMNIMSLCRTSLRSVKKDQKYNAMQ